MGADDQIQCSGRVTPPQQCLPPSVLTITRCRVYASLPQTHRSQSFATQAASDGVRAAAGIREPREANFLLVIIARQTGCMQVTTRTTVGEGIEEQLRQETRCR